MADNIIFYFSDQQRWDTFNDVLMPNLTALASDGVTFSDAYTCQPVCGPARACLQTGEYATGCGAYWNGIPLSPDIKPLAEYFNEAGYDTAYIGKWHLASDRYPHAGFHCERTAVPEEKRGGYGYWRAADVLEFTSHGYDGYVFDENCNRVDFKGYRVDRINDFALEYIEKHDKDKPFFMFVSQLEPHHQNDHHCFEGPAETVEKFRDYPVPPDLSFLDGNYEKEYPDYVAAINRLDENLGKLTECLKAKGIYENTVIVYTSDHGCHFKTRNAEYKRSCHDSATHIPLVISGGSFKGGKTDERLVSLIDLPPTLLSLAGIKIPEHYKGNDLNSSDERECVFMQISESQVGRAIRTKDFKYSVRAMKSGEISHSASVYFEDYLYDLRNDPLEKINLIKDKKYSEQRAMLRKMLIRQMIKAGEKEPKIFPALIVRRI